MSGEMTACSCDMRRPLDATRRGEDAIDLESLQVCQDAAMTSSNEPRVVDIERLSLVFETADGPVHALSNVDLAIEAGEFVSFIGPSGCGKTTLLRCVADLERPTGGRLAVNGLSAEAARLARQYGYVFQAPALYPWRTIA